MSNPVSETLFSLSDLDSRIAVLANRKMDLEKARKTAATEISTQRARVQAAEAAAKDGKLKQALQEHRLRDEETRIIDRRKQLAALGNVKAAKLMEREIDIATRTVEEIETKTIEAMTEAETLENKLSQAKGLLEKLENDFESGASAHESVLQDITQEINSFASERDRLFSKLNDAAKGLYNRIRTKYTAGAVAKAAGNICATCNCAVPPQMLNQIRAGSLQLCPGCSRILVILEEPSAPA